MNILHVIDSGGLYGAEMVLLNLAAEQMKTGDRSVIASIGAPGEDTKPLESEADARGIQVEPFRFRNGPNPAGALDIMRYARTGRFDVVHTHGYKPDILLGLMPFRVRGLPIVCTLHGWTNVRPFSKMGLYEWADGWSLQRMDAVCVVSESMLKHPRVMRLARKKVHVIHNGISMPTGLDAALDDDIVEFCGQKATLAAIGRLSEEKGFDCLLHAFSIMLDRGLDACLLIMGDGPERSRLEGTVQRLGLHGKVLLAGYRRDAWRYLSLCRAFVLASYTEGFPITLLEVMQTGVPVIATAVGGVPLLVHDRETGIVVPPGSPESIAEAMLRVMSDGDAAAVMAEKAREFVLREYSVARMGNKYRHVYETLTTT